MKAIEKGIVFSNDINLILNSNNALDYRYDTSLPSISFIANLRRDFLATTQKIFGDVTIISEEEMTNSLTTLVDEVLKICPHCNS